MAECLLARLGEAIPKPLHERRQEAEKMLQQSVGRGGGGVAGRDESVGDEVRGLGHGELFELVESPTRHQRIGVPLPGLVVRPAHEVEEQRAQEQAATRVQAARRGQRERQSRIAVVV